MADQIGNGAKGRWAEWIERVLNNDPTNSAIVIMALQANEADDTLRAYLNFSTLLGAAGNTEATFTNYARVVYTDASALSRTVDNANDWVDVDVPDWSYTAAGGTVDNTLTKVVTGYDDDTTGGTDANILVWSHHDFAQATNGGDVDAQVAAAGLARAS